MKSSGYEQEHWLQGAIIRRRRMAVSRQAAAVRPKSRLFTEPL